MKNIIILITPPIIIKSIKKIKKLIAGKLRSKPLQEEPKEHIIESGLLKGKKIFFYMKNAWLSEMLKGTYDEFFLSYLKSLNLQDKIIFDIGAHIGYLSMCFAEIVGDKGKVYAFEPNIYNLERLKLNLKNNPELSTRVKVLDFAVSDSDGEEEFIFSPRIEKGASSGSFLDRAHTFWEKTIYEKEIGFKRMAVQTKSLDSLYKSQTIIAPDLMKIDIEGAEYLALRGAEKIINKFHPILLMEIHSIFNMFEIDKMMARWQYTAKLLHEEKDGRCFIVATHTSK